MRTIGGPLLIAVVIQFYYKADRFAIAYGGFCFLYGIYYLAKPLLLVAMRPTVFQDIIFNVFLDKQTLKLQEGSNESIIFVFYKNMAPACPLRAQAT